MYNTQIVKHSLTFLATTQKSNKKSHRCQMVLSNSTAEHIWHAECNSCVSATNIPNSSTIESDIINLLFLAPLHSFNSCPAICSALEFYNNHLNAGIITNQKFGKYFFK